MRITYKKRLFLYFLLIFTTFTVCIIYIEQSEEKRYRTEALEAKLDGYADLIHGYMIKNKLNDSTINQLHRVIDILPQEIRVTVIEKEGKVLFDKEVDDVSTLENHLNRPEILQAQYQDKGSHIRMSASTHHEYIYFAKYYQDSFVRVALPYNIQTQALLKADNLFIYLVIGLFIIVLVILNYVAGRFGKSISQLKTFTSVIKHSKPVPNNIQFPEDELGEIGQELSDIIRQRERDKKALEAEKEKLIRHFRFLEEGFCIFSAEQKQIYSNTYFIQYLNLIVDKPILDVNELFKNESFHPIIDFIDNESRVDNHLTYSINKNGKFFSIQIVIYKDNSFEVSIKDITQTEKTRLVKQEMTSNIAHELRTPVTSLRGYLETLNETNLNEEKQKLFIERAYKQSIRLSNLIEDVSLLSKIEGSANSFPFEKVNLLHLVNEVRIDLTDKLTQGNIKLFINIKDTVSVNGSPTLLYSIFRNLIDNSIAYAGSDTEIHINNYMEDDNFVYFSFYDTGKGVDEQHLNRLFERFYRVNEGRTRDTGGSGLGLSIVRNAIMIHKGDIQAKNKVGAGLEFLFSLRK